MQKKINAGRLITHRFPLAELKKAFDVITRHEGLKVCITCD